MMTIFGPVKFWLCRIQWKIVHRNLSPSSPRALIFSYLDHTRDGPRGAFFSRGAVDGERLRVKATEQVQLSHLHALAWVAKC